ncbi:hypothetical protein LT493_12140 [Streptomyces tricolor]|nr:hypothetical protein [Streptomyces tricolor]
MPFDSRPPDSVFEAMAADMRERELGCLRAGGDTRPHINTRNTARDLEASGSRWAKEAELPRLRGTAVTWGAVYGTMFPSIWTGACSTPACIPRWTWRQQFLAQARAVRENVDRWAEWTARRDNHFALGTTAALAVAAVEGVAAALEGRLGAAVRTSFDGIVGGLATDRSAWERLGLLVGALRAATAEGDDERTAALLAEHATGGWGARASEQWRQSVLEAVTLETGGRPTWRPTTRTCGSAGSATPTGTVCCGRLRGSGRSAPSSRPNRPPCSPGTVIRQAWSSRPTAIRWTTARAVRPWRNCSAII